jgi:hypothetical protein
MSDLLMLVIMLGLFLLLAGLLEACVRLLQRR